MVSLHLITRSSASLFVSNTLGGVLKQAKGPWGDHCLLAYLGDLVSFPYEVDLPRLALKGSSLISASSKIAIHPVI